MEETKDQPLSETCREFAAESFGIQNREIMGHYLESWITGAPRFARETSDRFIDRQLTNIAAVAAGCRERLAMIGKADVSKARPNSAQDWTIIAGWKNSSPHSSRRTESSRNRRSC